MTITKSEFDSSITELVIEVFYVPAVQWAAELMVWRNMYYFTSKIGVNLESVSVDIFQ